MMMLMMMMMMLQHQSKPANEQQQKQRLAIVDAVGAGSYRWRNMRTVRTGKTFKDEREIERQEEQVREK